MALPIPVYTPNQYFEIDNGKVTKSENHSLGMLPMVEYKLNPERMGLFEPAIPVLDAINDLESNRLDGVAQFIQSIMVFTNCLVDKGALDKVKELGAMCLKSTSGLPASVSQIANELDQQQSHGLLLKQPGRRSGIPWKCKDPHQLYLNRGQLLKDRLQHGCRCRHSS